MNCENMIELMQRFIDDDLVLGEQLELEAHVHSCDKCASTFEKLKKLSAELEQLPKVKPRYSIVDTILPKLAELDLQQQNEREESAALVVGEDSAIQFTSNSRTRGFFTNISWKITSAVAFAACAAVLFLWNGQSSAPSPEEASQLLSDSEFKTKAADEESTQGVAGNSSTMISGGQTQAPDSPAPAAIHNENEKENVNTNPTMKQPEVSALNHDQSKQIIGKVDQTEIPSAKDKPNSRVGPIQKLVDPNESAADDPAVPDDVVEETGLVDQGMLYSLSGSNELLDRDLKIANDEYVAEVNDRKLTISTATTNETVFSSLRQWSDTENISSIVWIENNRLYYEVTDNQTVHGYLIDVAQKTELLVK